MRIKSITLRHILNSGSEKTIETDVALENGIVGRASSPSAIKAGKREIDKDGSYINLKKLELKITQDVTALSINNQESLDQFLMSKIQEFGTNVTLTISIAYARAMALHFRKPFFEYLHEQISVSTQYRLPVFLIPVFSGGVHGTTRNDSFQQIMIALCCDCMVDLIDCLNRFNMYFIDLIRKTGCQFTLANSGGYVIDELTTEKKLSLLNKLSEEVFDGEYVGIAIDVAAEHLHNGKYYNLDNKEYSVMEMRQYINNICQCFPIVYLEDPFLPEDEKSWRIITSQLAHQLDIIGDDLFATQDKYISNHLATGAVIKLNQVGTLTFCKYAIEKIQKYNMCICVSHRSYETEDTVIADLSIAVNAKYVKVGNINREERIVKFNQFLRIEELL